MNQDIKKSRVFLKTSGDGPWLYCGGPNIDDALDGIKNLLLPDIEDLLLSGQQRCEFKIETRRMTDQEVLNLPDL